jgi:two-component system sensor histidine kinase HydH
MPRLKNQKALLEMARYKALGQMMAGFVHQFRTPLHVIQSSAAGLQESRLLLPKWRQQLEMIQRSAERLQASVGSLLAFSKGDTVPWTEGSLNRLIDAIFDYLEPECRKRKIQLEKHQNVNLPPIRMQTENLEEALLNLAVNAMEAMPKGGVLGLMTEVGADGKSVQARITDQGMGMDAKLLRKVSKGLVTTKKTGVGLGLYFTRQILKHHHAALHITSQKAQGTTVTVTFAALH